MNTSINNVHVGPSYWGLLAIGKGLHAGLVSVSFPSDQREWDCSVSKVFLFKRRISNDGFQERSLAWGLGNAIIANVGGIHAHYLTVIIEMLNRKF